MNEYQKAYKAARRSGRSKEVSKVLADWESTAGEIQF